MDLKMVKHPNYLKELIKERRSNDYLYESDGGFLAYWQAIGAQEESQEKVRIKTADNLPSFS